MKIHFVKLLLISFLLVNLSSNNSIAKDVVKKENYFASIKVNEANVRTGPSIKYPIRWQYIKENWPLKVTDEFANWRKFKDIDGQAGWIHVSLISKKRFVIFDQENTNLIFKKPSSEAKVVLKAQKNVSARLIECNENKWCLIKLNKIKGWVKSSSLWGV